MAMSQMNVRIDEDLREEGNLALESIGLLPSHIVRDLWSYAAKHRNNPLKLKKDLQFLQNAQQTSVDQPKRLSKIEKGWNIASEGLADFGVSLGSIEPLADDEFKERAYREHWEEKGLL